MMISNATPDYGLLDTLILQDRCFSVFRLPKSDIVHLVVQQAGIPEHVRDFPELNGREGFVVAPFASTESAPIVLIRPDIVKTGENEIFAYLFGQFRNETETNENDQSEPVEKTEDETQKKSYRKAFELFQASLRSNVCEKIVLSRSLVRKKPKGFSAGKTFRAASLAYPEAFVYLCHTPTTGTWLGSSPELLLSGEDRRWRTVALAGTMIRPERDTTSVTWDEKNIREQRIVVDYLSKQLDANGLFYTKNEPFGAVAGNLVHLKTEFSFEMDGKHIGDLLNALHPTPAVCGFPKKTTYRLIIKKEGYDRKYYSGFIGPISTSGKTDLFVNLRCMQIKPDHLIFYAGGGLLPDSELETEWQETEEKMQTMLSLVDFRND